MNDQYLCPLPTIREVHDPDKTRHRLEICGEPLHVNRYRSGQVGDGQFGPCTDDGFEVWELACQGRHVLLTHDTEDREAELTAPHLAYVLEMLGAAGASYNERPRLEIWLGIRK